MPSHELKVSLCETASSVQCKTEPELKLSLCETASSVQCKTEPELKLSLCETALLLYSVKLNPN